MATSFPTSVDNLPDPTVTDTQKTVSHLAQHTNANDAIEAIEAKVGVTGSADAASLDNRVTTVDGRVTTVDGRVTTVDSRVTTVDNRVTTVDASVTAVAASVATVAASVTTVDSRVTTVDSRVTANLGLPLGLTGATQATRYAGARASAVPTTGTFAVGDFVILQSGAVAICTVAGTPGTWATITAGAAGMALPDYIIYKNGSNYLARNTATNADDYTNTNAASVVQSAHDALATGGLIELKSGVTYNATSQVIISTNGVMVRSRPQTGEDQSTLWKLTGALSAGQGAFRTDGFGTGLGGISIDANSNADYGVDMRAQGGMAFEMNVKAANVANLYLDGPNGAARCMVWNIRSDNGSASGSINFKFDGPDHIAWGLRSAGTATNGYSLWMDTSRMQIASGHITGAGPEAGCVFISGSENRLSDFYMDSGPNGSNGNAHVTIQGSGNHLSALVQNAATQTAKTVTASSNPATPTVTTYRLTTSAAHGYAVGDAVWLEGFGTTFSGGATQNVIVTAQTTTTFDFDLGTALTFGTLGTSKGITKYGVLFQKASAGSFVQGNEVALNFQGKGAGVNNGEFYYAVGFLDENGNDITNFARFAGNRVVANAAKTTRFSNMEAAWGTTTNADKVSVDAWHYQNDTTTPMLWRTKASGLTAASTASTWTVSHGLAGVPSQVQITPAATLTNQVTWVSGVTATQFTINASASITNGKFYWKAEM